MRQLSAVKVGGNCGANGLAEMPLAVISKLRLFVENHAFTAFWSPLCMPTKNSSVELWCKGYSCRGGLARVAAVGSGLPAMGMSLIDIPWLECRRKRDENAPPADGVVTISCGKLRDFLQPQCNPSSGLQKLSWSKSLILWRPEHDSNVWPFP